MTLESATREHHGCVPVSVVLLTLNEEYHLPGALENLKGWAREIFIVDSLSTDRTIDIALEHGVHVVQRPFTNYGDQWNWALSHLPIETPWTLKIDPDERLSETLKRHIGETVCGVGSHGGYDFLRRLWFLGTPLHVMQPVLRLWRTGLCRFSDVLVNEHPIIDGSIGRLGGLLEHYDSIDLHHWVEKQNRYTTMEAIQQCSSDESALKTRLLGSLLDRRMWFKRVFWNVPFRYEILKLYLFFMTGAWRDGRGGLDWVRMRVFVYRLWELKAREIRHTGRIPRLPVASDGTYDPRILDSDLQRYVTRD